MDAKQLFDKRIELIDDAVRMKKAPQRVPFATNDTFWRFHDLGYKLSEALLDYQIMEDALVDFQKRYQFDLYLDMGGRNPLPVTQSLGNFQYKFDDINNTLCLQEQCHFTVEDYDKFAANPVKTLWEEVLPRKYTYFKPDMKFELLQNTFSEFFKNAQTMTKITNRFVDELGVPALTAPQNSPNMLSAFECLYNFLRGMQALSGDMRRYPEKVSTFVEIFHNLYAKPSIEQLTQSNPLNSCFTAMTTMLSQNVINNKQFEKYYWPYFKEIVDKIIEIDGTMFILSEGTTMRVTEYLQELPKGHFCFYIEMDDIFDARKRLPNLCLWGGIPLALLSKGTKEQCVDHAKKVIDEAGSNGGLILATNKFTSSPNDCNRENLLAVSEFVRNYTKEKNYA